MRLQDNATFLHINYWNDEQTLLQNVGLLLHVPGMSPLDMLGTKPPPGRNFVLGADATTLVPLLRNVAGVSTRVPFLVYLSSNVSLTSRCAGAEHMCSCHSTPALSNAACDCLLDMLWCVVVGVVAEVAQHFVFCSGGCNGRSLLL